MLRANKWHETEVLIYNEEDPTDLEGGKAIREITSSRYKMTICYRQYIAENDNPDSEYPILLQAVAVSENDTGIEIKASLSGLLSAKFPRRLMNVQELPGAII